ncbi:tetratricopeptide repeat protein [Spirochaeta dissipatitropha]
MKAVPFRLRCLVAAGFLFCLLPALLTGQTSSSQDEPFFPFISSLRVAVRDDSVRLTWRDVPAYNGNYRIYRHHQVISESNLRYAELAGTTASGSEVFTDKPQRSGNYYYAVLTERSSGEPLAVLIPFRNQTVRPVTVTVPEIPVETPSRTVENIAVEESEEQGIKISYEPYEQGKRLALFRSTQPLRDMDSLASATLISIGDERVFYDFPPHGIAYYYGLFEADLVGSDELQIIPGSNTTETAIVIEAQEPVYIAEEPVDVQPEPVPEPEAKPAPEPEPEVKTETASFRLPETSVVSRVRLLPRLQSVGGAARHLSLDGFPQMIPESRPVAPEALEQLHTLLRNGGYQTSLPEPAVHILGIEHEPVYSSSSLEQMIKEDFLSENWSAAAEKLKEYLKGNISKELEDYARFYRGQSLYFSGNYQEAFFELLLARDRYYAETMPFIYSSLYHLR